MSVKADIVLRGGPIWCGREEGVVEALALWGDKVLAAGKDAEIAGLIGPATKVIDLAGRLATPGLNDSHLHLISLGLTMDWVDARPAAAPGQKEARGSADKKGCRGGGSFRTPSARVRSGMRQENGGAGGNRTPGQRRVKPPLYR